MTIDTPEIVEAAIRYVGKPEGYMKAVVAHLFGTKYRVNLYTSSPNPSGGLPIVKVAKSCVIDTTAL